MTGAGGNTSVQSHRPFGVNPRALAALQHAKRRDQAFGFVHAQVRDHFNTGSPDSRNAPPADVRRWISTANNNFLKSGSNYRVCTRRCLTVMTTGFQCHKQQRTFAGRFGLPHRIHFSMRLPVFLMIASCDQAPILIDNHGTDRRIRFDMSDTTQSNTQSILHDCFVIGKTMANRQQPVNRRRCLRSGIFRKIFGRNI